MSSLERNQNKLETTLAGSQSFQRNGKPRSSKGKLCFIYLKEEISKTGIENFINQGVVNLIALIINALDQVTKAHLEDKQTNQDY